jgi:transcriptional regulator with XRE-family HTH domain
VVSTDISRRFGLLVRKDRLAKKLSQEALAEKADIHPTHVGLIERGLRNPSLHIAQSIALALGYPLWQLVREAESRERGRHGDPDSGRE